MSTRLQEKLLKEMIDFAFSNGVVETCRTTSTSFPSLLNCLRENGKFSPKTKVSKSREKYFKEFGAFQSQAKRFVRIEVSRWCSKWGSYKFVEKENCWDIKNLSFGSYCEGTAYCWKRVKDFSIHD